MKRTVTTLVIFIFLAAFFGISAYADTRAKEMESNLPSQSSAVQPASNRTIVQRLYIQTYPEKTVYKAFESLDTAGLSVRAVYDDGSEEIIDNRNLEISYQQDERFRVGDERVAISYGGRSVYLPVTVERIPYDLSSITPSSFSVEYNGKHRSYTEPLPNIVGLDGIPLEIKVLGGGTSVGVYSITLDFSTESRDYLIPESKIVTMTVLPYETEIVWSDTSFVYDGKSKIPTAYYTDVNGAKIYAVVSGAATEAGSDYIAKASVSDPNYKFKNTSTAYEIKKADYDFSSVVWSDEEFVYDGTQKRVYLSGLPDGVSIVGYNNDRARSAGSYTATARLSWDDRNYNAPETLSHTWQILPAEYDMSGVRFLSTESVYDGNIHYPTLEGKMPTGADGIRLEYSFSCGATHVSEGEVSVTISFSTKSSNYLPPDDCYATVKITPKMIRVTWSDSKLSYTGELLSPSAFSSECPISVSGGGVNVGLYNAVATAENSDFLVENKDFEFEILKAQNFWTVEPSAKTGYEGSLPNLIAEAKFGKTEYRYFSDPECKNEISPPTSRGRYYAIAYVSDCDNYFGISSSVIPFEVIEVVAVGITVDITKTKLKVFDSLIPSDFTAYVLHNDGSTVLVSSALVEISYQNGGYLKLGDEKITFSYKDFSLDVPVEVYKADYDLGGVLWENSSITYDGTPKSPMLVGLPEGIKVVKYIGAGVTEAGVYTVTAVIEYDAENYNKPDIPSCEFTVKRCVLPIPVISAVYNGKEQTPVCNSPLYTIAFSGRFVNAGKYAIAATLTDPDNYEFADTASAECVAVFEITPKPVYISVHDVNVHLWDKIGDAPYEITEGGAIGGDELVLSSYVDGETLRYRSENPNYTVIQTGGEIKRLPYPSARGALKLLLWLLLLTAVVLLVVMCIRRRHRIANAFAVARCRWNNRKMTINPPKKVTPTISPNRFKSVPATPKPAEQTPKSESTAEDYPDSITEQKDDSGNTEETFEPSEEMDEEIIEERMKEIEEELSIKSDALGVDAERADELITDSLAKNLVRKGAEAVYTDGNAKSIINVDTLSENFSSGERIDVNALKSKSLVPYDTAYIKVLARGIIDKPLTVYANDFSLSAVKMIALTGGEAIKTVTLKTKDKNDIDT